MHSMIKQSDIDLKRDILDSKLLVTDGAIAASATAQLKAAKLVPHESCLVTVRDGLITIQGEVTWGYQRVAIDSCLRGVGGVTGVSNSVVVKPQVQPKWSQDSRHHRSAGPL